MRLRGGFTLIELLVVVALIMILSIVGIGSYTISSTRSYDTQRKNDLGQISKALNSFSNDTGRYPLSDVNGAILCYEKNNGVISNPSCVSNKLTIKIDGSAVTYITIPNDPDHNHKYVYNSTTGSTFALYGYIQNISDRDLLLDESGVVIADPYGVSCGSDPCNYKVTEVGLAKTNE